ncbi:LysR family transcriptional regulator [Aestuariibius sp. 2305UL40-4]|uniref:LysR family transcriptional regulator n=1 Tax=Aestuariibius violaceus TaxID=3234132 RepID=UPI00345E882D
MADSAGRITLWGVEVFVATAEERSISAAARRLGASPATVSQQITNLEGVVGTVLLDRTARPVVPTAAGQMFLRRANVILNEAAQARAELALADYARLTRLRLGVIEDFDADVTPRLLAGLAEKMTDCQFLLETGASHRLMDLLDTRALDVAVVADQGDAPEWAEVHPVLEEPFVAAIPKGYAVEELRDKPLISYTSRHVMGRQIAAHLQREGLVLSHRFELDSYHAILAMVAEGLGWSILTPLGWRRAQRFRDRVSVVALPFGQLSRRISLIARKDLLGKIPTQMAEQLRREIEVGVVAPSRAEMPWLGEAMRVL